MSMPPPLSAGPSHLPGQSSFPQTGINGVLGLSQAGSGPSNSPNTANIGSDVNGSMLSAMSAMPSAVPIAPTIASRVASGSATLRVLEFCDAMSGKGSGNEAEIQTLDYWKAFANEFYTDDAVYRQVVWNPSVREQRTFELPTAVIPRYLHSVYLSGIVSHSITVSRTKEWPQEALASVPTPPPTKCDILGRPDARTTHFVQADRAKVHIAFDSGWLVVHTGILRAALTPVAGKLKFQFLDFVTSHHESFVPRARIVRGVVEQPMSEETIARIRGNRGRSKENDNKSGEDEKPGSRDRDEKITVPTERWSMPDNPVNEYGLSLRVMRCLEITESVCQLRDLMDYADQYSLGPMQALRKLASEFRASHGGSSSSSNNGSSSNSNNHHHSGGNSMDNPRDTNSGSFDPSGSLKRKAGSGGSNLQVKLENHSEGQDEDREDSTSPQKRLR